MTGQDRLTNQVWVRVRNGVQASDAGGFCTSGRGTRCIGGAQPVSRNVGRCMY